MLQHHTFTMSMKDGTVSTRLVAAKSRLAPLKAMSNPQLELMGELTGL